MHVNVLMGRTATVSAWLDDVNSWSNSKETKFVDWQIKHTRLAAFSVNVLLGGHIGAGCALKGEFKI